MERHLWVNEGAQIGLWDRLHQYGITHLWFSERTVKQDQIDQARAKGFQVGLYTNPQWYGFEDPAVNRLKVSRKVTALDGDNKQMDVMVNMEKLAALQAGLNDGGIDYIRQWVAWWRRVRPSRRTFWSMEGFQGGWYWSVIRGTALPGFIFVPQAYDDKMNAWDSHGTVKDLVDWGAEYKRVVPFNRADGVLLRGAEGFFYMEHLLP